MLAWAQLKQGVDFALIPDGDGTGFRRGIDR
jgi:hypothetical protein